MTDQEKRDLIATLKDDLANRPRPPEFEEDFMRDMMQAALEQAEAELSAKS